MAKKNIPPATKAIKKHRNREPQWRIDKMPQDYKGQCCNGNKKWGDGKGILVNNERVFYCHACWAPLPKLTPEEMLKMPEVQARIAANKARAEAIRAAHSS